MPNPIEKLIHDYIDGSGGGQQFKSAKEQRGFRFAGFIGKCDIPDWTRLYFNAQLDEYIEVDDTDIHARIELGGPDSPFMLLVVDYDADIKYVTSVMSQIPAEFVSGEITRRNLSGNRLFGGSFLAANSPLTGASINCGSFGAACGSWFGGCGSFGAACGSWAGC